MSRVLIIGCAGQDGRLLIESLSDRKANYLGISKSRTVSNEAVWQIPPVDISRKEAVQALITAYQPTEVYYLAAVHASSEARVEQDYELFEKSYDVHARYLLYFLESIRSYSPSARLFYAATSHIYGNSNLEVLDERGPFLPNSIYGMTKLQGLLLCRYYREKLGVFASAGILFNHESHYRENAFVSRRIVQGALRIKQGQERELVLGNLSAKVDWGFAPDYVEGMQKVLSLPTPDDYVIASGKAHSVMDFVKEAFTYLGLRWEGTVREDSSRIKGNSSVLVGNSTKLREKTGWVPKTSFSEMVRILIQKEESAVHGE